MSVSLCVRATSAIFNYPPINKFHSQHQIVTIRVHGARAISKQDSTFVRYELRCSRTRDMGCCSVHLTRIIIESLHQLRWHLPNDNSKYKERDPDPCTPENFSYYPSLWIFHINVPRSFTTIPELCLLVASSFRHAFIIQDFLHPRLHDCLLDHVYAT